MAIDRIIDTSTGAKTIRVVGRDSEIPADRQALFAGAEALAEGYKEHLLSRRNQLSSEGDLDVQIHTFPDKTSMLEEAQTLMEGGSVDELVTDDWETLFEAMLRAEFPNAFNSSGSV